MPLKDHPFIALLLHARNYLSASIATKAIGFISLPVITRLLSPDEYGVLNVFISYIGLFMGGMSLIYGKLKWLPVFYSSREINDFQPFNQKYRQVVVFSPENCARAVNGWTKHLTHAEGLTDESARLYANDGMTSRLKLLEHLKRSLDISAVELLKKKILLKCYHFLYGRVFEKKSAEFYNDFQKIKTIVSSACLNSNEVNKIRHDYLKDDQNQQKACP